VEFINADDAACVVVVEAEMDLQGSEMRCLTGQDLTEYDYVSVGKDGFVPINEKPMMNVTRLNVEQGR
jgi:hypothetical protein